LFVYQAPVSQSQITKAVKSYFRFESLYYFHNASVNTFSYSYEAINSSEEDA